MYEWRKKKEKKRQKKLIKKSTNPEISSQFQTEFEQKRILHPSHKGLLIDGRSKRLTQKASFEHLMVNAPTGSGKTSKFIIPALLAFLDQKCSCVVSDPSGEIRHLTSGAFKQAGFNVLTFNLENPLSGTAYEPIELTQNDYASIDKLTKIIIPPAENISQKIWTSAPAKLITCTTRCLQNGQRRYCNLHNVAHLIANFDAYPSNPNSVFRNFIQTHANGNQSILNTFNAFINGNANMLSCYVAQASDALGIMNNEEIAQMMSKNEFQFDKLRTERTIIYITIPETNAELYTFIINAWYSQLFDSLKKLEYKTTGNPVYCLLDEAGHYPIHHLQTQAATVRKFKLGLSLILQGEYQLEDLYGKATAKTIKANMNNRLYLHGLDVETSTTVEKELGKTRIENDTGIREQTLMGADRVRRIYDDQAFLLRSNEQPIQLEITPYYENKKFNELTQIPPCPVDKKPPTPLVYYPLEEKASNPSRNLLRV